MESIVICKICGVKVNKNKYKRHLYKVHGINNISKEIDPIKKYHQQLIINLNQKEKKQKNEIKKQNALRLAKYNEKLNKMFNNPKNSAVSGRQFNNNLKDKLPKDGSGGFHVFRDEGRFGSTISYDEMDD